MCGFECASYPFNINLRVRVRYTRWHFPVLCSGTLLNAAARHFYRRGCQLSFFSYHFPLFCAPSHTAFRCPFCALCQQFLEGTVVFCLHFDVVCEQSHVSLSLSVAMPASAVFRHMFRVLLSCNCTNVSIYILSQIGLSGEAWQTPRSIVPTFTDLSHRFIIRTGWNANAVVLTASFDRLSVTILNRLFLGTVSYANCKSCTAVVSKNQAL